MFSERTMEIKKKREIKMKEGKKCHVINNFLVRKLSHSLSLSLELSHRTSFFIAGEM